MFTEEVAARVCEKLQRVALPQLTAHEQMQLVDIVECVSTVEKQRRSLDEDGARFMLFFRQRSLLLRRQRFRHGRGSRADAAAISWREINWALHSGSQDILADFVARQFHGAGLLWENARESGIFMWLTDANAVVRCLSSLLETYYLLLRDPYPRRRISAYMHGPAMSPNFAAFDQPWQA